MRESDESAGRYFSYSVAVQGKNFMITGVIGGGGRLPKDVTFLQIKNNERKGRKFSKPF